MQPECKWITDAYNGFEANCLTNKLQEGQLLQTGQTRVPFHIKTSI